MKTEDQVWTVLVESNPVPDVNVYGRSEVGGAAYLATLEQRSSEVTELDTSARYQPTDIKKRSVMPWLAAAAVVVVVGVAAIVLSRADGAPVASANIEVIDSMMDAWNLEDGEVIASHFTADGVFDVTSEEPAISEVWVGRSMIAERTAGYSRSYGWDTSFDFTDIDGVIVLNRIIIQPSPTDSGTIGRPQGVAVTITDGLIESFVVESPDLHFCIGETTTRCKVRETGEVRISN